MYSFRKLIYFSFYFWNINFSFCSNLNLYKKRLDEIEKKFILNNINSNIKNLNFEIEEKGKKEKEKKTTHDDAYIKVGNAIINIYETATKSNKTEDFRYICDSLAKANLDFSQYDETESCWMDPILILRSLFFNALKKEKINAENLNDYIGNFKVLNEKKIIGKYTYHSAEEYIFKSIFDKVAYDDIKNTTVLKDYSYIFCPDYSLYFDDFLNDLFAYIVDIETKYCNQINESSKKQIGNILNNFPVTGKTKYYNYVEFLFWLFSKNLIVVYDPKKGSFLLRSIDSYGKINNKEIENKEKLEEYKKTYHSCL